MLSQAQLSKNAIATATTAQKNAALNDIAQLLYAQQADIIAENVKDLAAAQALGLTAAQIDRLLLDAQAIAGICTNVEQIISLTDPVRAMTDFVRQPSGISVGKMRVPIGVIVMIYEARPNVTIDAAALCLKSGNAVILRGGKEAWHSNQILAKIIRQALANNNLPVDCVQMVTSTDRNIVSELIANEDAVDLVIPRGSKSLIARIVRDARVPVLKHLDGNCHVYIDGDADINMAINIAINSKTRRYGVCNACESLVVAAPISAAILPVLGDALYQHQVTVYADSASLKLLPASPLLHAATQSHYSQEFLGPEISIKIVPGIAEAIAHINTYGSHHSDTIVSNNYTTINAFTCGVDSSSVLVNAATGFADGFEYGLGAEIGISTAKLHVRGPVGLEGLTIQKYVVFGSGQIRT